LTQVVIALMWLVRFLPLRALAAVGSAAGMVAFWLVRERREVTRINLAKCFPDMQAGERERLARAHFRAFGRSFAEHALLWWAPRERVERLVRVAGLDRLQAQRGTPVILFAPHFIGFDAGFTRLACEIDMVAMYARQKDALLSERLERGRTRFGDQRLVSRQEGVRAILVALREGRPFFYLPDQDYGPKESIFVPFFGVPTATVPGLSRLARLAGAKVMPCVTRILPGGEGYALEIEPPWEGFPSGDLAADTRRMNAYIERKAIEIPEQYLWMHKRFKTRPAGEARFYA